MATRKVENQWKMLVAKLNNSSGDFVDSDLLTRSSRKQFYEFAKNAGYRIEKIEEEDYGRTFECAYSHKRIPVSLINFDDKTAFPCQYCQYRQIDYCEFRQVKGDTGKRQMRIWKKR